MFFVFLALTLGIRIPLLATALPIATTACEPSELLKTVDQFLSALSAGSAAAIANKADNFTYYENNKKINIASGIISKQPNVTHNRTTTDLVVCASYTEIIAPDPKKPYVIGAQIRHDPGSLSVLSIDTIVSTTGSWLFNAAQTLSHVVTEKWDTIDASRRDSRATLKNAADAYLDMWSNKSAIAAIPWGNPCNRLEGSQYVSCQIGLPTNNSQAPNVDRRYVIDESVGSVTVFNVFQHLQNASDSHELRLEGGKVRYVHAITVPGSG